MADPREEQLDKALDKIKGIEKHLQDTALKFLLQTTPDAPTTPTNSASASSQAVDVPAAAKGAGLRDFVESLHVPHRAAQEIPAFVYWARENDGKDMVSENDVWELYKVVGSSRKPPKLINQALRDIASKNGWLESVKGKPGYYQLTRAGEIHVIHDLKKVE